MSSSDSLLTSNYLAGKSPLHSELSVTQEKIFDLGSVYGHCRWEDMDTVKNKRL